MASITYRGSVEELKGTKWDVPSSVPFDQKAAWIESKHKEQQALDAADAERQQRESDLLSARIRDQKSQEAMDLLQAEVMAVSTGLEDLSEKFGTAPDVQAMTEWNASSSAIFARSMDLADEVKVMQATVSDLLERTAAMAEAAKTGDRLQQEALQLLRNQQLMMNGSFETYRNALFDLETDTRVAQETVGQLNTTASESREVVEQASRIQETAIDIARQEAKAETEKLTDEFLALIGVAFEVMGIDEKQLALQLNSDEVMPNRGVFLTREYLRRVKDLTSGKGDARDKTIDGPLL